MRSRAAFSRLVDLSMLGKEVRDMPIISQATMVARCKIQSFAKEALTFNAAHRFADTPI